MPTTLHAQAVEQDLDKVFTVPFMEKVWNQTVRAGLRRQPIGDLHDFLDIHRNLRSFLQALRADVRAGGYRPKGYEVALAEKRDGVSRRLMIPTAGDALLLQTIVEVLEAAIGSKQPHPNAFYARSHTGPQIEEVDGTFAYPWWLLWPQFQQRIWQFTQVTSHLVITDLANYFDCIPLDSLRRKVASFGAFNENVINFLFYLLDAFVWRPYYRPHSGVGLPQINFDAPRLLAHSYLFSIDAELNGHTGGNFVRWMDDINCGVGSVDEGKRILRALETVLNSHGVRLNSGKTRILTAQEAVEHFWIQENRALTILGNQMILTMFGPPFRKLIRRKYRQRLRRFLGRPRRGQWDKVLKRYFSLGGTLKDPYLQRIVPDLLANSPGMRGVVCRYYQKLGFSRARMVHIEDYLASGDCLDDASLFEIARLSVEWCPPYNPIIRRRFLDLGDRIAKLGSEHVTLGYTVVGLSAATWVYAKYATAQELGTFLKLTNQAWRRSEWCARQVAACLPLLTPADRGTILNWLYASGLTEATRVVVSLVQIRASNQIDKQLSSYLRHPPTTGYAYPLGKALIGRVTLDATQIPRKARSQLRRDLKSLVQDRWLATLLSRRVP